LHHKSNLQLSWAVTRVSVSCKFLLVLIISNILGHKLGRTRLHGDEGERTLTGDGPVLDAPNNTQCNARTSKRSSQLILRTSYHPVDTTQRTTIHTPSARSCTDRHRWTLCIYWFNFQRKKNKHHCCRVPVEIRELI
jgi:hypothetical protein